MTNTELQEIRESLGLTKKDLAEKLNIKCSLAVMKREAALYQRKS